MAMPSLTNAHALVSDQEELDHYLQAVVHVVIHPTLTSSLYGISCRSIEHLKLWWASACTNTNAVYYHPTPNVFRIISTNGSCPQVPGSLGIQFTDAARLAPNEVPSGHPQHRRNDLIMPIKNLNDSSTTRFLSMRYITPTVEIVPQRQPAAAPRNPAEVDLDDTLSLPSEEDPSPELHSKHYDPATGGVSDSEIYSRDSDSDGSAEKDGRHEYYASDSEPADATALALRRANKKKQRDTRRRRRRHRRQPRSFAPEGAPPVPRPLSPMDESDILAGTPPDSENRDASLMDVDTSEAYQAQAWIDANDEANAYAFEKWMADQRRRRHKQIERQCAEEQEEQERIEWYHRSQLMAQQQRGAAYPANHVEMVAVEHGRRWMEESVHAIHRAHDVAAHTRQAMSSEIERAKRVGFPALYQLNPGTDGQKPRGVEAQAAAHALARAEAEALALARAEADAQARAHMAARFKAKADAQLQVQVETRLRAQAQAQAATKHRAFQAAAVLQSQIQGPSAAVGETGYTQNVPGNQEPAHVRAYVYPGPEIQPHVQQPLVQQPLVHQCQSLPQFPPVQNQTVPAHPPAPQAAAASSSSCTPSASSAAAWSAMSKFPPPASLIADLDRQGIPADLVGAIGKQVHDHLRDKMHTKVSAVGLAHLQAAEILREEEQQKSHQDTPAKENQPMPPPPENQPVRQQQLPQMPIPQDKPKRTPLPNERPLHTLPPPADKGGKMAAKKLNSQLPR